MSIKQYPIFLASSYELQPEREKFEIFIGRQNKRLLKKNVQLSLEIWEDMGAELNNGRKQDDYNKILNEAEIVVVLFWTKMGKYTLEEFELAYKKFEETGRPIIYVYEKTLEAPTDSQDWETSSKKDFLDRLLTDGKEQFHSTFENYGILESHFLQNLLNLFDSGALSFGKRAELLSLNSPLQPSFFLGREQEMELISSKFQEKSQIILISGEGGLGKTTLASKYWYENQYTYAYCVYLICEQGIINAMVSDGLGLDLAGLSDEEQLMKLQVYLRSLGNDCLLVLDNVNEEEEIDSFIFKFRAFSGNTLITSRCRNVSESVHEIVLEHLSQEDAKVLFKNNYMEETVEFDTLLDKLLEAIDYHTLLVEVFSKNMAETSKNKTTLNSFLERLEDKGLYLDDENNFKVKTLFASKLERSKATPNEILSILYDFGILTEREHHTLVNLSLLPSQKYSIKELLGIFEPENEKQFQDEIQHFFNTGWLGGADNQYRLSPVIQKLALEKNKETLWEDGKVWVKKLTSLIKHEGKKDNAYTKFKWIPFGRHLANSFVTIPHPDFIHFLDELRKVLILKGGISSLLESKSYIENVLNSDFFRSGVDAPMATYWLSNLALTLEELGGKDDLINAKEYFEKCLQINTSYFDENHPRIAADRSHLALVLLKIGGRQNLLEAKILLEFALRSDILNSGELSGDTATTRSTLAMVLKELGGENNLLDAKMHLEKAIKTNLELFEEISPSAARDLSNYATLLQDIGGKENLLEAKHFLELALSADRSNFPENSPHFIWYYHNLGIVLKDLEEKEDLIDSKFYFEKAMDLAILCFGEDAPIVNECREGLAGVLFSIGGTNNVLEAKKLLEEALISTEREFGKENLKAAPILFRLGTMYAQFGDIQAKLEGKNLMEKSLAIYRMNNFDDDYFKVKEVLKWLDWVDERLNET